MHWQPIETLPDDFKQRLIKLKEGGYVLGVKCNMGGYDSSDVEGWIDPDLIQSKPVRRNIGMKKRRISIAWTCCDQCHVGHRYKWCAWLHFQYLKFTNEGN